MKRILVAMSGGVDSTVAAYLMQEAGYDCTGVTMRLYREPGMERSRQKSCCAESDEEDAAYACWQMGIPHESVCFSRLFERQVIDKFVREYQQGYTPNPCLACNRFVKFDALLAEARRRGFDGIATGHYARITRQEETGRWQLRTARDSGTDQSYVLYMLTQEQLAALHLPLGELLKTGTRNIAEGAGLVNAEKRESQDICFIPDGDYGAFLERWTGQPCVPGEILSQSGAVLGEHRGAVRYTIGQRRGLGVAAEQPLYVIGKDVARNTVTVGPESALYRRGMLAEDFNWLSVPEPMGELRVSARTRYHQPLSAAAVRPLPERRAEIWFEEPQRAITPGQAVVLYEGDLVLGGGTVREVL